MPWASAISAAWSTSPWRITLAPSGGSGESQAFWVAIDDLRPGSSASAPPPQPWPRITETVGTVMVVRVAMQRAISPAMAPSSASGESSAPGVSITVTSGRPSSSASRIPRRASRSAAGTERRGAGLLHPVLADEHARLAVEPGQRDEHGGVLLALLGAVEREGAVGAVPQQIAYAEPRRLDRVSSTDSHTGRLDAGPVGPDGQGRRLGRVDEHRQRPVDQHGQVLGRHDGVDDALLGEVLGLLDALAGTARPRAPRRPSGRGSPTSAPGSATVTCPSEPHDA